MNKYPNGYLPKVVYHFKNGNYERANSFLDSHIEKYGMSKDQLEWLGKQLKK